MARTLEQAIQKWPGLVAVSDSRKRALNLMFICGWRLISIDQRGQKHYKFSRPDTGGLYDAVEFTHARLDPLNVAQKMIGYEPELRKLVDDALFSWIDKKEGTL
jgi:hypothetical protein